MKKLMFTAMLATFLLFNVPVSGSYGRRAYLVSIVDSLHENNADEVTSFTVNIAGSTAATIYANASTTTAATNPIVDSSTATDITTLTDGYVTFWYAGATCDIILSDGTYTKTHSSVTPRNTRLMFDSHLYTAMTEFELLDAESISFGTHDDWVAQSAVATILTWTPLADNSAFNIGVSGASLNSDFNVYVGTALGLKVDAGTPSLIWDGGVCTLNHNSSFNVGINTGTSTANTTIGSGTAGTIALDTTAGITVNADDSYALTVSAGTIGLGATGGDITIDATDKSVIIRGTEEAADAILIDADGTAGGVRIDSGTGDITLDSDGSLDFDAGDNVTIDAADDITLDTADGGISLIADGAGNGDITLDSQDDIILTSTGKVTITNTEAVTISGALQLAAAFETDIVHVPDGAAYDVLAANSGKDHLIPGQTADMTMDLPAEADHLHFRFVYVGAPEDAQDWIIDSENNTNYFVGGLMTIDDDDHSTLPVYSDGADDSILTVLTPGAGTVVEIWSDGTLWYVTGTVVSGTDTAVTFTNL